MEIKQIKSVDDLVMGDQIRLRPLGVSDLNENEIKWLLKKSGGEPLDDIAWTKLYHSFVHENPRFPKCKNGTLPDFYLIGSYIMARGGTLCKEVYFYELVKG